MSKSPVFGALAEFERDLIRERTNTGLAAARARGRKGGRKALLEPKKKEIARALHANPQLSVDEICKTLGVVEPLSIETYATQMAQSRISRLFDFKSRVIEFQVAAVLGDDANDLVAYAIGHLRFDFERDSHPGVWQCRQMHQHFFSDVGGVFAPS